MVLDGMRGFRDPGRRADLVRLRPAAVAMALAFVAYLLGRSGGPLCDPDGLVQLHGLWHVLSAVALGLWARARLLDR